MNTRRLVRPAWAILFCLLLGFGCASPYRSDQGALAGGLTGAGLGAIVGNAVGNTGAGAAIGAGVGALSGAAIGGSLDEIEANNRAEIEARLGRPAPSGAVTVNDVVNMTRAGVPEDVVINHIQHHGAAAPLAANDLIALQQQGVSSRVVQALQAPPVAAPVAYPIAPQPVYMAPPPPYWGPGWGPGPYGYYYRPYPRRGYGWGVAIGG